MLRLWPAGVGAVRRAIVYSAGVVVFAALPVDWLLVAYNGLLAVLWMAVWPRAGSFRWLALAHALGTLIVLVLPLLSASKSRFVAALRQIYPLIALIAFWIELGHLLPLLHSTSHDAQILYLDRLVLGTNLHAHWMSHMAQPWLSEAMYLIYVSYNAVLVGPVLALLLSRRTAALEDLTFRLTLTYLGCCLIYLVYPVVGPTPVLPLHGGLSHGLFFRVSAGVQRLGDSLGTSFPSTHVAAATTIALGSWRWFSRPTAWILTLLAAAIAASTVYTQNHYAIDAVAGVVYAIVVQIGIVPLITGRFVGYSVPPPLPQHRPGLH